jgi:hypothetical protein
MDGDFWYHMGFMTVAFACYLLPSLASRRMDRSDYVTLLVVVIATFVLAILPGIALYGFDKNSGTYVLAGLIVIVVATLNRTFPTRAADPTR